ncbi:unnamed protein product, partial [Scytosiphon promiscuus]
LISNNFAEIKSSVFKKFDKHNLFQLSCHDVVERFKLALFLAMIMLLNVCQGGLDDPVSQSPLGFSDAFFVSCRWRSRCFRSRRCLCSRVMIRTCVRSSVSSFPTVAIFFFLLLPFSPCPSFFLRVCRPSPREQFSTIFVMVFGAEVLVDWIKHGFIIKFNQLTPSIYDEYATILKR